VYVTTARSASGQTHDFPSKTAALNCLLIRLHCWSPPPWEIKTLGK